MHTTYRTTFFPAESRMIARFAKSAALPLVALLLSACPVQAQIPSDWGAPGDIRVQGDFDGDGKLDYAVWRPSNGTWYVFESSLFSPSGGTTTPVVQQFGLPGDVPVPGDYDLDGKTDFAVWRPSEGAWYVLPSGGAGEYSLPLGQPGDIPLIGDFSDIGSTDYAVWRPSEGNWYIFPGSGAPPNTVAWGLPGDIPMIGSFEQPGILDYAVWRPSEGNWYILPSDTGVSYTVPWGLPGDIPVPGDYDGDGITDFAVWRPSDQNLYIRRSTNPGVVYIQQLASPTDVLATRFDVGGLGAGVYVHVITNWSADGQPDFVVWQPSTGKWFDVLSDGSGSGTPQWGLPGDVPVPGKYGPGPASDPEIYGVWRPSEGNWYTPFSVGPVPFGLPGDIPIAGDFDGDGRNDYAVWRPSNGNWYIMPSSGAAAYTVPFGLPGDIPVAGDYDGDRKTDVAVWRPSDGNWYIAPSDGSAPYVQPWGLPGDVPIAGDFNGDGLSDFAVWRPSDMSLQVLPNGLGLSAYVQELGLAGSLPIYSQPPLTPFIGPAVRTTLTKSR
jgi:hypothetical protein